MWLSTKCKLILIELQGADMLSEFQCNSQVRCIDIAIHDQSILMAVGEKIGPGGVFGLAISPSSSLLAVFTKGVVLPFDEYKKQTELRLSGCRLMAHKTKWVIEKHCV